MNYKKVKITVTTVDEQGAEVTNELEFEGAIKLDWNHERPIVPSNTFMGGQASFMTTGSETLAFNLVNKTVPKKV